MRTESRDGFSVCFSKRSVQNALTACAAF